MGSCQNYGPFLGTLNKWCRNIRGTLVLTTTHIKVADIRNRLPEALPQGAKYIPILRLSSFLEVAQAGGKI